MTSLRSGVKLDLMKKILGDTWKVMDYKFVCAVPTNYIPNWIKKRIKGQNQKGRREQRLNREQVRLKQLN